MIAIRIASTALMLACIMAVQAAPASVETLRAAIDGAGRPDEDRARDAQRKPAEVLAFLGIGEGMTVMDVIAAGGWYTEVLAAVVGEDGKVYAQNPPEVLRFRDGANDKALTERLAGDRLPNVVRIDADLAESNVEPGSLDAAITALNFHDVYARGPDTAVGFLQQVRTLLKPGGVLGITDHVGIAGADNAALHRIEKSKVIEAAKQAGFEIAGESDLLANPDDDHTQMVFAPGIRGETDRFVLKLVNPG
ncbi:MAG TPA: hypothetical protein VF210_19390 [Pseudomonadales bacterium]